MVLYACNFITMKTIIIILLGFVSLTATAQEVVKTPVDTEPDIEKEPTAAKFPGGDSALFAYVAQRTCFPTASWNNSIEGKVFVQFTILANGKVDSVVIRKGLDQLIDAQVVRIIKSMPAWQPALNESSKPVAIKYTMPVSYYREQHGKIAPVKKCGK